ncbi:hypothetical protein BO71DRAFT_209236 [Aspergillus ellipticus CBS 707.79]|uniref:Uncharacterized protein n=1 Tax=Aspergillus ellipticus CBS 707.79 TaxID=1448320 RepID=A0A319DD09_9EURO|nr:hypothetical protein BO71DRAFT_209236 [Aspergillus ellipticus CBS 707.79]
MIRTGAGVFDGHICYLPSEFECVVCLGSLVVPTAWLFPFCTLTIVPVWSLQHSRFPILSSLMVPLSDDELLS